MRVILDREKCQGHGRCYVLAPEVFGPDEEGYGTVRQADVSGEALAQARLGEQGCPEVAIRIEASQASQASPDE
jgi:ferredoxin